MTKADPGQTVVNTRSTALLLVCAVLCIWEFTAHCSQRFEFLISRPTAIGAALIEMAKHESLVVDIGVTAAEALLGTALGTLAGSAVGLALWLSKRTARVAAPFIVVAANFPIFALAPAAIVWLGIGLTMKVFLAAFATFFVSLNLSHHGAMLSSQMFGAVFDGFRASRWDTYTKVIVPGALDSVFNSMRVNVGLGILGAFIGEFIASSQGLGRAIIRASSLYQIDRVFAASLCIIGLALLFDQLARGAQQHKLALARVVGIPRRLRRRMRQIGRSSRREVALTS